MTHHFNLLSAIVCIIITLTHKASSIEDDSEDNSFHEILYQFLLNRGGQMTSMANKHYHVEYNELNGCHFNPIAEEIEDEESTHTIMRFEDLK